MSKALTGELIEPKRPQGRPITSPITQAQKDDVILWISDGKTLSSWCKANNVPRHAIRREEENDPVFSASCARARELFCAALIDDVIDIADEEALAEFPEAEARRRARIDARKWIADKMIERYAPKRPDARDDAGDALAAKEYLDRALSAASRPDYTPSEGNKAAMAELARLTGGV